MIVHSFLKKNTLPLSFMPSHTLISFLLLRLFPHPLAIHVVLVGFCLLCRVLFSSYYMQTSWETWLPLMPSVIIWVVHRWVLLYNKTTWAYCQVLPLTINYTTWASYLTSVSLNFHICMKGIIVSTSQRCWEESSNEYKALNSMLVSSKPSNVHFGHWFYYANDFQTYLSDPNLFWDSAPFTQLDIQ